MTSDADAVDIEGLADAEAERLLGEVLLATGLNTRDLPQLRQTQRAGSNPAGDTQNIAHDSADRGVVDLGVTGGVRVRDLAGSPVGRVCLVEWCPEGQICAAMTQVRRRRVDGNGVHRGDGVGHPSEGTARR